MNVHPAFLRYNMSNNTLSKTQRLKSAPLIGKTLSEGKTLFKYPFKLFFKSTSRAVSDDSESFLFSVSIPKRKIRSAVKRNLLKRRTRESYRLHRNQMLNQTNIEEQHGLMFVYIGDKVLSYKQIEKSMKTLLGKLALAK